jgi:hypothetical protein
MGGEPNASPLRTFTFGTKQDLFYVVLGDHGGIFGRSHHDLSST